MLMRHVSLCLFVAATTATAGNTRAQERATPEAALQAKLASPFLAKASWVTDYDAALAAAAKRKTLIFGYFTTANY